MSTPRLASPSRRDLDAVARQLGRPPRGVTAVAHRCPCGLPDVVETAPRLPDGTPFPTLYYLTCPRAAAAVSRLEAAGTMRAMTQRLAEDPELRADYQAAHERYVARRSAVARREGVEPLPDGAASAGGMPDRVKCLHALLAYELAEPGSSRLGRETLAAAGQWWADGPCVPDGPGPVDPGVPDTLRVPDGPGPDGPRAPDGGEAAAAGGDAGRSAADGSADR